MDEHKTLLGILAAICFILGMLVAWAFITQVEINHILGVIKK